MKGLIHARGYLCLYCIIAYRDALQLWGETLRTQDTRSKGPAAESG